jgi:hypothetical protein
MSGRGLMGVIITVVIILGVVYAYNRFSGKNIAALGAPAAKA